MKRFDNNLEIEGLEGIEGRFAGTPFNCFSITRDNCIAHDDPTDYGYGIILWLHPNYGYGIHQIKKKI